MPPSVEAQGGVRKASGSSGDLLYANPNGNIAFYTYPQGEQVGIIYRVGAEAFCTDSSGDVWVAEGGGGVVEYAHGGTQPIKSLLTGSLGPLTGCSVDPTTGNLAVYSYSDAVYIFASASGYPTKYPAAIDGYQVAYDSSGNLFVDSIDSFALMELPRGETQLQAITFDKTGEAGAGGLQWDGQYMAISTTCCRHHRHVIFRFKIHGTKAVVVQTVLFGGWWAAPKFWIQDGTVVASVGRAFSIGLWRYPQGRKRYDTLPICCSLAVAVSGAPSGSRVHP